MTRIHGRVVMQSIVIKDSLFDLFPDFHRGIIVIENIENHQLVDHVKILLQEQIDAPKKVDQNDHRLQIWNQAHLAFGSNPNKYPPSIKSLIKRIQKNPELPYINTVVALFNYISIKYCLPCGGDDMDGVTGDFTLGFADGTETFQPLGTDKTETPTKGEVIYYDSATKNVMCRRWNWRNGERTKIETSTKRLVINIDCLLPGFSKTAIRARDELAGLLEAHCQAALKTDALHAGKQVVELN